VRIRQVRPEFFSDAKVARLPVDVRLTYVGLWCVADDAGWLEWDVVDLGAQLFPHESIRVRERRLALAGEKLVEAGRMVIHPCGCARIPTLEVHQKIGGNKAFTSRDRHARHVGSDKSIHSRTDTPVGRYVGSELGSAQARENDEEKPAPGTLKAKVAAYGGPTS
jgi:hypothetical protein